jgi:hypothetical protein
VAPNRPPDRDEVAQSPKVLVKEIGNQSRTGSPIPVCVLHVVREMRQCVALPPRAASGGD